MGMHQRSSLSPCLFAMLMDMMADEIREEAPWTMMPGSSPHFNELELPEEPYCGSPPT